MIPHNIRPYNAETDSSCVLDSWWRGLQSTPQFAWLPRSAFSSAMRAQLTDDIADGTIRVDVACDVDDPSQIFGWVAYDGTAPTLCLHWVYVKQLYRRNGIARMLCGVLPVAFSCWSWVCTGRQFMGSEYHPELFFTPERIAALLKRMGVAK